MASNSSFLSSLTCFFRWDFQENSHFMPLAWLVYIKQKKVIDDRVEIASDCVHLICSCFWFHFGSDHSLNSFVEAEDNRNNHV